MNSTKDIHDESKEVNTKISSLLYQQIISCIDDNIPSIIALSKVNTTAREAVYRYYYEKQVCRRYDVFDHIDLWCSINGDNCRCFVLNADKEVELCCYWMKDKVHTSILSEVYYTRKLMITKVINNIYHGTVKFFVTCKYKELEFKLLQVEVPFNISLPSNMNPIVSVKKEISPELTVRFSVTTKSLMNHHDHETKEFVLTNPVFQINRRMLFRAINEKY